MDRGVLFDFDGTLADTMRNHFLAWREALLSFDVMIEECEYYPLEGMSMHQIALILLGNKFNALNESQIQKIIKNKKQLVLENASKIQLYPGVEEFLELLSINKFKLGIVTASHLDQLRGLVPKNFLSRFQTIVCGDQVINSKPHPEPFILGLSGLKIKRENCIAIENSPLGVRSAKAAGLYCIGVSSTVAQEQLIQADEIVPNFIKLENTRIFKKLLRK